MTVGNRSIGPWKNDWQLVGRTGGRKARPVVKLTDEQRAFAESEPCLRLCRMKAKKFADRCSHIPKEDFFQAAFQGLSDAVKAYDESKNRCFEAYADRRINGACIDLMRGDGLIHLPRGRDEKHLAYISADPMSRSSAMDDGWGQYWMLPPADLPPVGSEMESRDLFERWLRGLPAEEKFIIRKYYGPEEWTMRRIAEHLGWTEALISLKHRKILARLRDRADLTAFRRSICA